VLSLLSGVREEHGWHCPRVRSPSIDGVILPVARNPCCRNISLRGVERGLVEVTERVIECEGNGDSMILLGI
jgi:hypothetical protein